MTPDAPRTMHNLTGTPVVVGGIQMRAATGFFWGGTTYHGLVQRKQDPARDIWSPGKQCRHRHPEAESALACAQQSLDEIAAFPMEVLAMTVMEAAPCGHCGHLHFIGDREWNGGACGTCACEAWRPKRQRDDDDPAGH